MAPRDARERLISAGVEAFARKGFHGTSTRDIAVLAKVSPAALYVHFKTKEELLYLISRTGHQAALERILLGIACASKPTEQVAAAVRAFVLEHVENTTRSRVITAELAAISSQHRPEIVSLRRSGETALRRVVQTGVRKKVFKTSDVKGSTRAVLSLSIDVARWFRPGGALSGEAVAEQYVELSLRMLGVQQREIERLLR